ncbi:MAG: alpha/beta fold hydrolase, partial [Caldisericia bacterium]|nr:alpha/beta fold hydrolase [Caldisericia bacterium]
MEKKKYIAARGRQTAYYHLGEGNERKLILLHGNASSAAFFFPTLYKLAEHFEVVAPDLNGFGDTEAVPVKAPTALHDWAQDVNALAQALGFERFALLGWSLGGGVAWRYAALFPEKLSHLVLLSPMSPFGFGGTRGEDGEMYDARGWGAPGGFANPAFIAKLKGKDRGNDPMAARAVL